MNVTTSGLLSPLFLKHGKTRFVVNHFRNKKFWPWKKLTKELFSWMFVLLLCLEWEIQDFGRIYIFSAILFYFCEQNPASKNSTKKVFGEFFPCPEFFILKMVHYKESYTAFCVSYLRL